MRFGEVLIELGFITQEQLDIALKEQEYNLQTIQYSEPIGNILLRNGVITEKQHDQALLEYFKRLSQDETQPAYVKETAKVACKAMMIKETEGKLSEESKLALLKKIHEYEEKIAQYEKSINTLSKLEPKKVILETIEKENKEIQNLIKKIEIIKKDVEKFC